MLSTQVVSNPIKPNALFLEQIFCMPLYYSEMEFKDYLYEHNFYNFSISPNCKVGENKSEHLYHKTYIFGQDHTRKQKHPHTRFQRARSEGRAIPPPSDTNPLPSVTKLSNLCPLWAMWPRSSITTQNRRRDLKSDSL